MTTVRQQAHRRTGWGFVIIAAVLGSFLAGASAPTPLYARYAAIWQFSPITVTVVFGVYAIALLITLLVTGSLSDSLGRRPVILLALGVQILGMVIFLLAQGLVWLYVGRVVQGIATGLVTAAASAALLDLEPADRPGRGPLANAVMPTVGLASGALLAGALVQYGPAPLRLVYGVLGVGYLALAAAMLTFDLPPTDHRPISLRPRIGVHPELRATFLAVVPCIVACWSLGGLYLSLGPSLMLGIEHSTNRLLGGAVVFALCAAGALCCLLLRRLPADRIMIIGCLLLIIGLAATVPAILAGSGTVLVIGSIISGAGFGAGFLGSFRHLVAAAEPQWRGGLIASIYTVAYLSFAVPAVIAGIVSTRLGLPTTTIGYAGLVAVLVVISIIAERLGHRRSGADR